MHRTIRNTLTSLTLASLTLTGLIATPTPPAEAHHGRHNHTWVDVNTTRMAFQKHRTDTYSIKTRAHHRSGKGITGKAILIINGDRQRWHRLKHGNSLFRIHRDDLPRGKSKITVWIKPTNPKQNGKIVRRYVIDKPKSKPKVTSSSQGARVMAVARAQLGKPYRWGGAGPGSYDCSGLTAYAYKHGAGIKLPHYSGAQRNAGRKVTNPRPGDIAFTPGHVSLCATKGCTVVIEAARPGTDVRRVSRWQRNPTYIRP